MADKPKTKKRRKSGGGGGGRFGVDMTDAGLSLISGSVGKMANNWLLAETMPDIIKKAEPSDAGLYILGVLFKRRSLRSVGAGLILSRSVILAGVAP